jgi:hypothetical protein
MKVYVVMWYHYEDTMVCGVYSTRDLATQAAKKLNEEGRIQMVSEMPMYRWSDEYDYEEHEVDVD